MAALVKISRQVPQLTCYTWPCFTVTTDLPTWSCCHAQSRHNSYKAGIARVNKKDFVRTYPVLVVQPDGSSLYIRYKEPRQILRLPEDLTKLTEEQKAERRRKLYPVKKIEVKEEIEDDFDPNEYAKML
ncbi:39S ribosomal protein L55, mitochondrial-like isoform X2 [Dreissena polymorpha]|uniref:Mitochondrial ribosomal protein L55 n=1 Tax=Dreissena polymorpha TaxID=45954 RepID=A0A9D4HU45_DREPO|nr:39S ribosomal protein L55, mitochondrial-like isoform X2 [Dreissena polymorpha]KAH3730975.1 hypothetical protein DPMN_056978 [Dreissena polymorpha]